MGPAVVMAAAGALFFVALVVGAEGAASSIGMAGGVAVLKSVIPFSQPPAPGWVVTTGLRLAAYLGCFYFASPALRIVLVVAIIIDVASDFTNIGLAVGISVGGLLLVADKLETVWIYETEQGSNWFSVALLRGFTILAVAFAVLLSVASLADKLESSENATKEAQLIVANLTGLGSMLWGYGVFLAFAVPFYELSALVLFATGCLNLLLLRPTLMTAQPKSIEEENFITVQLFGSAAAVILPLGFVLHHFLSS